VRTGRTRMPANGTDPRALRTRPRAAGTPIRDGRTRARSVRTIVPTLSTGRGIAAKVEWARQLNREAVCLRV
jgi:hypothetical protein